MVYCEGPHRILSIFLFLSEIREDTAITSSGAQVKQLESPLSHDLCYGKEESFVPFIHEQLVTHQKPLFLNLQKKFSTHLEECL